MEHATRAERLLVVAVGRETLREGPRRQKSDVMFLKLGEIVELYTNAYLQPAICVDGVFFTHLG